MKILFYVIPEGNSVSYASEFIPRVGEKIVVFYRDDSVSFKVLEVAHYVDRAVNEVEVVLKVRKLEAAAEMVNELLCLPMEQFVELHQKVERLDGRKNH